MDFVKRLRHAPNSPRPYIPIVMMLESGLAEDVHNAMDSGVNEIMINPIDAQQFYERFVSVVKSPRIFITADTYKGPCRRRHPVAPPANTPERRVREIRLVRK
jgi:CheY-like chemotaxis protein